MVVTGGCTSVLTHYIYKARYKKWLKDNASKYVRNKISGRLTRVPIAFISLPIVVFLPTIPVWASVIGITGLNFGYNCVKTKHQLKKIMSFELTCKILDGLATGSTFYFYTSVVNPLTAIAVAIVGSLVRYKGSNDFCEGPNRETCDNV